MKRTRIRPVSLRRSDQLKEYSRERKWWLVLPENRFCVVAASGILHPLGIAQKVRTTDVHHKDGREGKLLLDKSKWLAVCRPGHTWIHDHSNEARKRGWLI